MYIHPNAIFGYDQMFISSNGDRMQSLTWPSQYPYVSPVYYLRAGALWIGAELAGDTLVSTGWLGTSALGAEMFTCCDSSCGLKLYFSPDSAFGGYKNTYWDTVIGWWQMCADPYESTYHRPLGVEVFQQTVQSLYLGPGNGDERYKNFVIMDYTIKNISGQGLENVYLGILNRGSVSSPLDDLDDITGFLKWYNTSPSDSTQVDIAWVADNDGDPDNGVLIDTASPTAVNGIKILRAPSESYNLSHNWWIGNWGPFKQSNFNQFGYFPDSSLGFPWTDKARYRLMSNGEIDYNQNLAHLDFSADGWLPPPANGLDLANGQYAPTFVLSVGPFDLPAGDTLRFAFATIIGERFHGSDSTTPYPYDSLQPQSAYYDFSDLATSAYWAQFLYDSLFNPTTDIKEPENPLLPRSFTLYQNYPNPFNAKTSISFSLHESGPARLEIYNLLGQRVAILLEKELIVGSHTIVWDGKNQSGEDVTSGIYFYRLTIREESSIKKMTLLN